MTPEVRKIAIDELKRQLKTAEEVVRFINGKLRVLKEGCQHTIVQRHESAVCEICGKHFGWWCPDSPDHVCHYDCDYCDGHVKLIDGTNAPVPANYQSDYASEYCMFCLHPDERK